MLILDEINMPIDEFMYAVHDFRRDDLNELLLKVRHFVSTRDIEGMKNFFIHRWNRRINDRNFIKSI
ncbi:hypothetical protein HMPREF9964_2312 [Streptococcus dysgalactiae subsp. equisimilis SK1249]|nr:hypothetical protein HMPREF9964_2312 [Streptococcus dysgalactiae subsp. equisimilis SK1249]